MAEQPTEIAVEADEGASALSAFVRLGASGTTGGATGLRQGQLARCGICFGRRVHGARRGGTADSGCTGWGMQQWHVEV